MTKRSAQIAWRALIVGGAFVAISTTTSCTASSEMSAPDPNAVVARFSGGEIKRVDIAAALQRRLASEPVLTPEVRRLMVRRIVERRVRVAVILAEAKAKGFDRTAEAQFGSVAAAERVLAADLVEAETASARADDALVTDAFERRLQAVRLPDARKFSHIYLRAEETDASARKAAESKMQSILAELKGGASFNALAERYSDSVDARGGGRVEWTYRKDLRPGAAEAIFTLPEGGLSSVDATPDGLHLYRVDGVRSSSATDPEALRRLVRKELDDEARSVAARALRQGALDAAGVEFARGFRFDPKATPKDTWIARWKGGSVGSTELYTLLSSSDADTTRATAFLRELVENRLLAARRREKNVSPALAEEITAAETDAVLQAYRTSLVAQADTVPTEEEIVRYHSQNGQSALFLRDYRLDALFFPQSGESAAEVYAAGEKVVASLRAGTTFDRLLDAPPMRGALVCRDVHDIDIEKLGQEFLPLRKAILNLAVGDVSAAIYFGGPKSQDHPSDCLRAGKGLTFVRLREIKTLPLDRARAAISNLLSKQKTRTAIDAIQARLIAGSGLQILLPEG